jgi:hypothetical protein
MSLYKESNDALRAEARAATDKVTALEVKVMQLQVKNTKKNE